jgi:transcriptional regulator with XRE-family HTH domain
MLHMESMNKRLRIFRELKKLSQKEVSDFISVPVSTYRDWEYGREISGEPYLKLAEVYGVSLADILGIESSKKKKELLEALENLKKATNDVENAIRPLI